MLILIVLLPLFGFFSGIFFGRYLNVCFISTFCVFNSFLFSLSLFADILATGVNYKLIMGSWISIDTLQISWSFLFDSLTSIMLIVVTFISTLVHLYSTEYMEYDPHLPRFKFPNVVYIKKMAINKAKSPTLFTSIALIAALFA